MRKMMNIAKIQFILISISLFSLISCETQEDYKNTSLSFDERVEDLVGRMTLEEKVSQLSYNASAIPRFNIPEYNWWNECLHGVGRAGISTVYPQAIGMAAMWDDSTMFEIANSVSDEARAKYHQFQNEGKRGIYQGLTYWTPNINIFRDPRWGRGMETYGEDPYLSGKLGVAYIKGLQGNNPKYLKLVATAKHFAVHSGPEISRHSFDANPSQYDFLETYSPQFKMAIDEANVYSVMCAYNRYQGMPCCGNKDLSNLLRKDWGFDGYIVSDCWAVKDFYAQNAHEIVNTKAEAAAISVKAGTDLNCGDSYPALIDAVKNNFITEAEIDISVKRIMLARMKLGMFDDNKNVPFSSISPDVVDSEKHKDLALDAARKSMVLLKNDGVLPFSKKVEKVAVIGPNANNVDVLLGNYHGYPSNPVTPFHGIKNKLPESSVEYAPGCQLAEGLPILTAIPKEFLYTDASAKENGFSAEYFNNMSFSGEPAVRKIDECIDFVWWNNAPETKINADTFSVRWTGELMPPKTGRYAIGIEGFPNVKIWVNNKELISYKSEHHPQKQYEYLDLEAGNSYSIRLEYIQNNTEYASAHLLWEMPNNTLKEEAIELASQSDLVVLCMGLSPLLEGEEMKVKVDGFSGGDRDDIKLPATQSELIKEIHKLGKPTVLVLLNGSALAFNWEAKNIPAILEAWYPGQSGGTAIADILFGDYNPSGRLPITFYNSVNQLPTFDNYSMEGRTYRYYDGEVLFPFGFGLSYADFQYDELIVPEKIIAGEEIDVTVKVTNKSNISGEEIVQMYISHPDYKGQKAIRSLKGFKRIELAGGESKYVTFSLLPKDIAVLNKDHNYVIDKGQVLLSIGGQQPSSNSKEIDNVLSCSLNIELIEGEIYTIK